MRSSSPPGTHGDILRTLGWLEAGMDLLSQASSMESRLGSSLAFTGSGEVSKLPRASGAMDKRKPTPIVPGGSLAVQEALLR
jgi:hypothetical protein